MKKVLNQNYSYQALQGFSGFPEALETLASPTTHGIVALNTVTNLKGYRVVENCHYVALGAGSPIIENFERIPEVYVLNSAQNGT